MERRIGKDIHRVSNKIGRKLDCLIEGCGCTHTQFAILNYILKSERDIFQRDIEEEFAIRRSSVSAILSNMESKGYIKRNSVSQDARLKKITVTRKGKNAAENTMNIIDNVEKQLISQISDEELDIFYGVLKKLSDFGD